MASCRLYLVVGVVLVAVASVGSLRRERRSPNPIPQDTYVLPDAHSPGGVAIAGFQGLAHKVSSGNAIIKDSRTILIESFSYDGAGPDAYFLVGTGVPNVHGRKIADEKGSYEVLGGYVGRTLELILPPDLTWNDVDYLSVFCISFNENFGQISIPKGLV